MGTSGNFSAVASSRPLKLLMTPSGLHKGRLKASDLLLVDAQGRVKAGTRKPSAETLLHLEIIRAQRGGRGLAHALGLEHDPFRTSRTCRRSGRRGL